MVHVYVLCSRSTLFHPPRKQVPVPAADSDICGPPVDPISGHTLGFLVRGAWQLEWPLRLLCRFDGLVLQVQGVPLEALEDRGEAEPLGQR